VYKNRENAIKSLPKLKGNQKHYDKGSNRSSNNNNNNNNNSDYSSLINYCDKKKHLSF
jgi:hypothetical protein